ncbi:ATP-binding cassette domain-containing protein [Alteromonas stellipolaris]|uniref:Probable ATP-binding protein YheS n=1 Tax=Alteromonas stellipolaris TaxID=233316 RepID=A0AAW7Z139_9ALTE|nr:ATP-binding cassette domain-containing protein [Alteromonas stellipolaris]MDO6576765.1 ATP-binding cassette domain-containing protein [Alteromonas stellipolaris]MDP2535155.1 ATP-binding cassette domain-containing protein [Alteromonas stellipolaris]
MIKLTNVSLMRGRKVLLKSASAQVFPGHKVALIGSNGCGKSTLFALLRNEMSVDAGDCVVPADWRIVSVAQETPATDRRAIEYVIDGDKNLRRLQAQLQQAEQDEDGVLIGKIHGQLEQAGAYDVEARAATILSGLGFTNVQLTAPVTDFSGGWRMRLNLAQALLCPSDLLLLDEPTNHLDLDAVIWLEKWLQRYEGTLLLISHDKAFIDNTVAQIISVEQQQLITYTGNYSAFERQRAERLRLQNIEFEKQQQKVAHLTSFITRFKAKASKAKQAQSRIKQLEKMETLLPAHAASPFSFEFVPPAALPNPLVQMEHVQLGYDDHIVLQQVKLNLVPGSRIGLLGRNGQGKSTLIKLLAGVHAPKQGVFDTAKGLKIGYFAQHQLETLDPNATPILHLQRIDEKATEQQLRDYLGGFGFNGDEALSAVAPMSGGEKARLVLALIVYQKPNLLLLDEPTNHLDLEMRHALNIALQGFEGAMVLVSHDRFLLSSVCEDFYLVDSGEVAAFTGDLDDYRDWILKQQAAEKAKANSDAKALNEGASAVSERKIDRKEEKRREAEFRKQVAPLKKALEKHEKAMDKCSSELKTLETSLSDTSLYNDDKKAELMQLLDKQAKLTQQLEEEEMQWLDAQEQMEAQRASYEAQ